jgi:xanthine/CO dehydrogenase XdhC/CoxF family maturation factor
LELKAETPEEIAVSIMAQIILLRALGAAELPGKTEAATPLSMAGRR